MKIEVHHYHHQGDSTGNDLLQALLNQGTTIMTILDTLKAQVEANNTVTQSAITLINGLKAKLDEALAANDTTALQALSDTLGNETSALAAAVITNTPATATVTAVAEPATAAVAENVAVTDTTSATVTTTDAAPAADSTPAAATTGQ